MLPFDSSAAAHYADVVGGRDQIGLPIDGFDAQIASICRAHGAALATRNLKGFRHADVKPDRPVATPVVLEGPVSIGDPGTRVMYGNRPRETLAIKFCPDGTAGSTSRHSCGHDQSGHCLGRLAVGKAVLEAQRSPGPERRRMAQDCTKLPTPRAAHCEGPQQRVAIPGIGRLGPLLHLLGQHGPVAPYFGQHGLGVSIEAVEVGQACT